MSGNRHDGRDDRPRSTIGVAVAIVIVIIVLLGAILVGGFFALDLWIGRQ